ncbi:hypothetical protein K1719_033359 [Acacia pycnantha]|nr:hypothetical protein K1719_033359 [Acacia pycnantha]
MSMTYHTHNNLHTLPPPKWDDEIPILMNEDTGSSSISNFHRIPEHHASNTPRPNFGGSQRANVNDGSMLILSVPLHKLWEEVIGRWESSTILHCSNISFANNQEKIKIGFTFPRLPEPPIHHDYPTLVRELINRNRDLEDQLEQLQKQLQQLKGKNKEKNPTLLNCFATIYVDNESVAVSCIIDSEPPVAFLPMQFPNISMRKCMDRYM